MNLDMADTSGGLTPQIENNELEVRRMNHKEPPTPFQIWFNGKVKSTGYSIKAVSRHADMDYTHLWRIVSGKPSTYPNSRRPGYANTVAIGQLLGDLEGAMRAADYPMPEDLSKVAADIKIEPLFHEFVIGEFKGQPVELMLIDSPSEEQLRQLRLAAKLILGGDNT